MDINTVIAENLGIVYGLLASFSLTDDQDAESLAYEALYNAILTYKGNKNTKLSTYAYCVVSNALRMHLRSKNKKRQIMTTSYYTPISQDEETGYLVDTIHYGPLADDGLYTQEFMRVLRKALIKVYNETTAPEQKKIFIMWIEENFKVKQTEIAARLGLSQAAVSRAISSFRYKLKKELEEYL